MRIAIDAMGGDYGPSVVVPAALDAVRMHSDLVLILVGDEDAIRMEIASYTAVFDDTRIVIKHTTQKVEMDESPASALRAKKDSSMRQAINLVKDGQANACVSAGNTGALMVIARFVLKMLPGIDRPAIIYSLPTRLDSDNPSHVRMLDLGANVDCGAEHLYQFAVMGSVLSSAIDKIKNPKVGLLNIGQEAIKGGEVVKNAAKSLLNSHLNYIGFVEGNDIFSGNADVIVCDGFAGNVALKTTEGIASMLLKYIKKAFTASWYAKCAAMIAMPVLKSVAKDCDPSRYNGASLLGLNGIVIKSHGNAKQKGIVQAINEALSEAKMNIPQLIKTEVEQNMKFSCDEKICKD